MFESASDLVGKCLRPARSGRKSVSIYHQTSGNLVWYRLQVEDAGRRWFVPLNEVHISWLQGVLQTEDMENWSFPSLCTRRYLGWAIHVGKLKSHHGDFLQISEQVTNRGVFKVLIPSSRFQ
ncbi:unnamed protein product [Linum trigynum]|uniref:Uncharacterized protein n=1 Tax=Linum trigynum TaxID=586398 RepID=A0AAV2CG33_9ROSI